MTTEKWNRQTIVTEDGNAELFYELISEISCEEKNCNVYGIRITFRSAKESYSESSGALSYSEEEVLSLMHTLAENSVTPISMLPIIDELYCGI